jgi:hypothetical protein
MSLLDLPDSHLKEILLWLLMLLEGIFECFHVMVHFLCEFIKVILLRLLGFNQSVSMMRYQSQLLFNLEYAIQDRVLAIHGLSFLYLRHHLQFLWRRLSNAGLNGAKLQSVKCFCVLLREADERLGSCYLNAGFILNKDSIFRETSEILTFFQGSSQSFVVWAQCNQLKQLSAGHAWLDLIIVYLAPFVVYLLNLTVLYSDPVNFLRECGLRIHHGFLNVFDEALMHLVSLGGLVVSAGEAKLEIMPLLTLLLNLSDNHCRPVIVFSLVLRAFEAVVLLFLMVCALIALANEQYFLSTAAIALVHEFEPEYVGNGFLHLVFFSVHL